MEAGQLGPSDQDFAGWRRKLDDRSRRDGKTNYTTAGSEAFRTLLTKDCKWFGLKVWPELTTPGEFR